MPIDPDVAIGAELGSLDFSWSDSDVLLYHLAIGATDLSYTLEGPALQVLPSFGVVAPTFHVTDPPPLDLPGCDINLAQVVHGSQSIAVEGPIPTSGSATVSVRISEIWDKGKAAVIWQEGVATSPPASGCGPPARRSSSAAKAAGAATAARRPRSSSPTASPTSTRRTTSLPSRPCSTASAATATRCTPTRTSPRWPGFRAHPPRPVLYGIVLRTLTDGLLGGDASRVAGFGVKFAGVVYPGRRFAPGVARGRQDRGVRDRRGRRA